MKAQCEHSDTGLCESCFKYEQRIAVYEKGLEDIIINQTLTFSGKGDSTACYIAERALKEGK